MRKKQHKRLNPKNTEYDRFYLVNYLVSDAVAQWLDALLWCCRSRDFSEASTPTSVALLLAQVGSNWLGDNIYPFFYAQCNPSR